MYWLASWPAKLSSLATVIGLLAVGPKGAVVETKPLAPRGVSILTLTSSLLRSGLSKLIVKLPWSSTLPEPTLLLSLS